MPSVSPKVKSALYPQGVFRLLQSRQLACAVLFDLDGVLVNTAEFHYLAWQQLADELSIPFSRSANEAFRGVSRMECLDLLLGSLTLTPEEKTRLADRKNEHYSRLIARLSPNDLLPGVLPLLQQLRAQRIRLALVSASRNARRVLSLLNISNLFDVIIDGHSTTRSKPDPQGFLLASQTLAVPPRRCIVVEDALAGLQAAQAAQMSAIAIMPEDPTPNLARLRFPCLSDLPLRALLDLLPIQPVRKPPITNTTPVYVSAGSTFAIASSAFFP